MHRWLVVSLRLVGFVKSATRATLFGLAVLLWGSGLCPGLRLQEGVKGKPKASRHGPLASLWADGLWAGGWHSGLAQGSIPAAAQGTSWEWCAGSPPGRFFDPA